MRIQTELNPSLLQQLSTLFIHTWWATERSLSEIEVSCVASAHVVFALEDDVLVGFARVLSDNTFLAIILDVIVTPDLRSKGVATKILRHLIDGPLQNVDSIELVCQSDLEPFYERFGFTSNVGGSRLMRLTESKLLTESQHL